MIKEGYNKRSESDLRSTTEYFEKRKEQITIQELSNSFGVILVHSLPDDTEALVLNDKIKNYTSYQLLEVALDKCLNNPIENLAFSSVQKGNDYNRWFGRFFGVVTLGGKIVQTSVSDANSWHKEAGHYEEYSTNEDILATVRPGKNTRKNEINIRTEPSNLLPFLDLDYALASLKWGAKTKAYGSNLSVIDQFLRFKMLMDERNFPFIGLYKGCIIQFNPDELVEEISHFEEVNEENYQTWRSDMAILKVKMNSLKPLTFDQLTSFLKL